MKFIAQCANTTDVEENVLTDGRHACTYRELPGIFAGLRDGFREHGIGLDPCLALECENSLPGALLLLYVLEGGYDFVLLPKPAEGCRPAPAAISFCRHRLTTVTMSSDQRTEINPSQFLHITPHPGYREDPGKNQDPRIYLQTSGSTGIPKLAVYTHRGLCGNALNCVERLRLTSTDRVAIPVPLFHMFGLGAAFLPAVAVGASIDLQKGANLIGYLTRERSFGPTIAFMTPSFCESLLKGRKSSPRAYRLTVTAGDRLRGDVFGRYEALYGPLVQLYGSTEMGAIAASSPDDPGEARAQTVGKPLAQVEVRLRDGTTVEDGTAGREPSETGDMGELWCRQAYGFDGYVDDGGAPVRLDRIDPDGWFRMNDLGRILSDERIQVLGRSDHSVNRSGLLVLYADVERTMMRIAGIETVVIVAHGESEYGSGMAAFCVPARGIEITPHDIHAACLALLPRRAVPDTIIVVEAFPLLPNGKVDRQALIGMGSVTA